jgi:hypothetical protein
MGETPHRVFSSCDFLSIGGNTMSGSKFLTLSGQGRICDMGFDHDGEVYILLKVKNEFDGMNYDDLWVKCWVNMFNFPMLNNIDHYLVRGELMTLNFDAQYLGFQQSFSGMSEKDPRFIVHLEGKLLKVHEFGVENSSVPHQSRD